MPYTIATYNPYSTPNQTVYSVNNNVPTYQNMRALFWNEDDRLNLVAGDGYLSYYAYGHDGNRAIKMTGNAAIDQTGTLLNSTNLENITLYPNEYLAITQAEYTKYYYAGGNRIASKIGTGGFEKMASLCTEDLNISGNANTLFGNALQQIVNITNQPNDEFPVNVCGGYSVSAELLTNPLPDFYISQTNLNFTQNNLLQQFRQNLTNSIEPVYYFHSDHLGSASWITSGTGLPAQHLLYLPFGEHFVNEHSSNYDERFTFTGKERDAETGYYYHGARFNCSDIGWLSVDPMSDKYPSLSPYAYCAWNPIKLVDLNGEDWYKYENEDGKSVIWQEGNAESIEYNGNKYENIGKTYEGITINNYELYDGYDYDYDSDSKIPVIGLRIDLTYNYKDENTDVRWVQTILRAKGNNCKLKPPYIDPCTNKDHYPFYYNDIELSSYRRDGILRFIDNPTREKKGEVWWRGELSVVRNNGYGYEPIITMCYGFTMDKNNKVSLQPINIAKPCDFTIKTLEKNNNEKKQQH